MEKTLILGAMLGSLAIATGCPSDPEAEPDVATDAGTDAATDPGTDAATDPGTPPDATSDEGAPDPDGGGMDAGEPDAGPSLPATKCDDEATVPQLCAPDGANQLLEVDLDVTYTDFPTVPTFHKPGTKEGGGVCPDVYVKPSPMDLRTYRGRKTGDAWMDASFPGPTLRLKLGDTLALHFSSSLSVTDGASPNDGTGHDCAEGSPPNDVSPNCFHGFNDTNIHYHGSHVSPSTNGEPQFIDDGMGGMMPNPDFRLVDNVFVVVVPSDSGVEAPGPDCQGLDCWKFPGDAVPPYELHFGEGQLPGTHWYHAHKHGSTALQMLNGLAGALIIDGDFEGIEEIEAAEEEVLVLQQISGEGLKLLTKNPRQAVPELLVNGTLTPTIEMKSGEVQRWRIISATQQSSASFTGMELTNEDGDPLPGTEQPPGACVNGVPDPAVYDYSKPGVYQIAQDGIEFLDPRWQTLLCNKDAYLELDFDSGNRADFLVVAPQTDQDLVIFLDQDGVVVKEAGTGDGGGGPGAGGPGGDQQPTCPPPPGEDWGVFLGQNPDPPLVRIVVKAADPSDPPAVTSLPKHLRNLADLPDGQRRAREPVTDGELIDPQTVEFQMNPSQGNAPNFYIDEKKFCDVRLDQCMALDTAEEWTITNYTTVSHPFHIHINPFFITHFFDADEWFTEKTPECLSACSTAKDDCDAACGDDPECLKTCSDQQKTCDDACPTIRQPDDPLPEDAGLLEPGHPLRRWQDTIGLPHAYIPPLAAPADECSPLIFDQMEAMATCPDSCAGADGQWNEGAWTCDVDVVATAGCDPAMNCVCSCAPNPLPIRRGFVKVRQRFLDFDGDFVIHCHILGHEDRGMMHRIGVRDTVAACDAAQLDLDGADCSEGASVCAETCQSEKVDLSVPLPDICQVFTPSPDGGGSWSRACLADLPPPPPPPGP